MSGPALTTDIWYIVCNYYEVLHESYFVHGSKEIWSFQFKKTL